MRISDKSPRCYFVTVMTGLVFLACSCAVHSPITEVETLAARTFKAPAGKGILFVYRSSNVRSMAIPRPIFVNGEHIVSNTNGTFVALPLKPGIYQIQAAAQALLNSKEQKEAYPDITLTVQEGKSYFIRQSIGGSIFGSGGEVMMLQTGSGGPIPIMLGGKPPEFKAEIIDSAEGRKECSQLKLVGSDPVL